MLSVYAENSNCPRLDAASTAVLYTLMYFDIFRHPLTTDEIYHNCQWHSACLSQTAAALETLQEFGIAEEQEGYWFLQGNPHLVKLRNERQERAAHFHRKAKKYAKLISRFPYVRGVCISGSLSKGTMDANGDIDYFIITQPKRLWIARTLLVLFKKVFLLNSKKYFCVNYFIDTDHLSIPDRNLFVATEIVFIRPMVNAELYTQFLQANTWTKLFYPNRNAWPAEKIAAPKNGFLKRKTEQLLNGKFGEWLDEKLLRLTVRRWKKKFAHLEEVNFEVNFRSRKNVSKHHPNGFQQRVLLQLEMRRKMVYEKSGVAVPLMRWEWNAETGE